METNNKEQVVQNNDSQMKNTYTTETVCLNCKGKGTSFAIRLRKRLEGLGTFFVGLFITFWVESRLIGFLGLVMILFGMFLTFLSREAKCQVCDGTGKVKMVVEK